MIIFDLSACQPHKNAPIHGGGKFAEYVFYRLVQRGIDFVCVYDSNRVLPQRIKDTLVEKRLILHDICDQNWVCVIKKYNKSTIFSILPSIEMCCTKCVGTIHDCREFETPFDWFTFLYPITPSNALRELMCMLLSGQRRKRHIRQKSILFNHANFYPTTITEYSKNRLFSYFPNIKFRDIKVFITPFSDYGTNIIKYTKKEKFFLMVSGNRPIKNVLRALIAFDKVCNNIIMLEYHVVVTGVESLKIFHYNFKHPDRIITMGYVNDDALLDLYKRAYAFIFPSLYEGFGIPPLEAMRVGTPVIAANSSAIPEVCGDAALYFNPFSISEISRRIIQIVSDKGLYHILLEKGERNYLSMKKRSDMDIDKYIDYTLEIDQ